MHWEGKKYLDTLAFVAIYTVLSVHMYGFISIGLTQSRVGLHIISKKGFSAFLLLCTEKTSHYFGADKGQNNKQKNRYLPTSLDNIQSFSLTLSPKEWINPRPVKRTVASLQQVNIYLKKNSNVFLQMGRLAEPEGQLKHVIQIADTSLWKSVIVFVRPERIVPEFWLVYMSSDAHIAFSRA